MTHLNLNSQGIDLHVPGCFVGDVKDRFREIIRQKADESAGEILNAVFHDLEQFTKGQKPEDDITLVIIKLDQPS